MQGSIRIIPNIWIEFGLFQTPPVIPSLLPQHWAARAHHSGRASLAAHHLLTGRAELDLLMFETWQKWRVFDGFPPRRTLKLGETTKNWWDLKVFCQEFSSSNPTKRWSNITQFSGKPTHLCRDGRRWHDRWRGRQTQGAPSPSYPDVSEIPPILCNFWPQQCSLAATQKIFPLS